MRDIELTRRGLLGRAAVAASALSLPRWATPARAAAHRTVALPSAARVRADFRRMVDFGPRYTGTAGHAAYIDWLEEELVAAGCVMRPRDDFGLTIWEAGDHGLELLDGPAAGRVPVSAYYPRSRETPEGGLTGRFVYAGVAPVPTLDGGLTDLAAALAVWPAQLGSWAQALTGTLGAVPRGSILLVDVPMPLALTTAAFVALSTSLHWPGHAQAEWLTGDFKRAALAPGITGIPLAPFQALGAAGVVFILDAPAEAIRGAYMPFENAFEDIPALYVDRDTGHDLRVAAAQRPRARLTLTARRHRGTSPALLGHLPGTGRDDEAIVLATHTDGEGFVEENGGVALVQLARHFGSLPADQRLRRPLVFSLWPGHMASGMPQLQGVIDRHRDVMRSAVAAITVEHLGCTEWADTADRGYHATGDPEPLFVWTTQGPLTDLVRDATVAAGLPRTALMRPPVQFGVGGAFQTAGVPQVGFLSAPAYLLNDSPGGDLDKLDAELAARQIAWTAELVRRLDSASPAALRTGDPTLGRRSEGPRAHFPAPPPVALGLRVGIPRPAAPRLTGTLHLNRVGLVRVHARVETRRHGRTVVTPAADALVRVAQAGNVPFTLRLTPRGRAALRSGERPRVVVTARFRERGDVTATRAVRPARA